MVHFAKVVLSKRTVGERPTETRLSVGPAIQFCERGKNTENRLIALWAAKNLECAGKKSGVFCTRCGSCVRVCVCLISNGSDASSANHRRRHCDASELMREKQKIGWGKAKTSENSAQSVRDSERKGDEEKTRKRQRQAEREGQRMAERDKKIIVWMRSMYNVKWWYTRLKIQFYLQLYSGKRYMNYRCRWKTD